MKTLNNIQNLAKLGKILSTIIFVCCIVVFCLSAVSYITIAVQIPSLKLGGMTIQGILPGEDMLLEEKDLSVIARSFLLSLCILCAGEGVLSGLSAHYFKRELADGTPFTAGGAAELLRLGVLAVCIPVAVSILMGIVQGILKQTISDLESLELGMSCSVSIGVMMIVLSLVCRYGAELMGDKADR